MAILEFVVTGIILAVVGLSCASVVNRISVLGANAMLDALTALVNAGGTGHIYLRSGSAPTNTTDADSGTLLATLTLSSTAFGAASSQVATAAAITSDTTTVVGGTAGHFRMKSGAGTCIIQSSVGTSGADLNFDNNVFVTGGVVAISSFTVTMPTT